MKLNITRHICEKCDANCMQNCPNKLKIENILCEHCSPSKAACFNACERHAIFECAKGILAIDKKKCNGCGKCIYACKQNAILLVNNKAEKCDLCFSKGFQIECIKNCANSAIRLGRSQDEIKTVEELLGWNLKEIKIKRTIKQDDDYEVGQNSNEEKIFLMKNVLPVSGEEAHLLNFLIREYRAMPAHNIGQFIYWQMKKSNIELNESQKENFSKIIEAESSSSGILKFLLGNGALEEIACIGTGKENEILVYHAAFGWLKTNLYFSKEETVKELINKMARISGRRLSLKNPKINAVLENGHRLNASMNPIAFSGINFTIRKFKQNPLTPLDLISLKTANAEALAFLWMAIRTNCSLLLCGNTGSGKTTTLNALFGFLPKDDRIIITEETPEINIPQKHVIRLKTSENISMKDIIVETLRMRPDRVIIGEIRNKDEVNAFMDTVLAGQGKGSFATFHAQSAAECLNRLKSLGVEEDYFESIDLIVLQKRWDRIEIGSGIKQDIRKITEIAEISKNKAKNIFKYDHKKDSFIAKGFGKRMLEKMQNCYCLNQREIIEEIMLRAKLLQKMDNAFFTLEELSNFFNKFEHDKQFRREIIGKYNL